MWGALASHQLQERVGALSRRRAGASLRMQRRMQRRPKLASARPRPASAEPPLRQDSASLLLLLLLLLRLEASVRREASPMGPEEAPRRKPPSPRRSCRELPIGSAPQQLGSQGRPGRPTRTRPRGTWQGNTKSVAGSRAGRRPRPTRRRSRQRQRRSSNPAPLPTVILSYFFCTHVGGSSS